MSSKRTKAERSQQDADRLEKRLDDRPEENKKKNAEGEDSKQAHIDSIKH